ncbi:hypothetical protein [Piscinibacter sakaiensis]|uniref:Tetratricopeptide repeat protein n=1 Tax=Piscinibacter sakaiensis TaxID=1547922 RepID=A0A0K8P5U3_PISS1|nr:hypothetical protein [Piscinibacter sakaiensis]GAP37977.1 hypothetical protein ISF6_4171 [Piscinibacter sakaiensis]
MSTAGRPGPHRRWAVAVALFAAAAACAQPVRPASDQEVVERLPGGGKGRAEERALRRQWANAPGDPRLALALARRDLDQARDQGEPRFAGRAMAALQPWRDAEDAPADIVLMLATVEQYLHDFDGAAVRLERLLQRDPRQAQAWLTLATIRRVQGRYAASDAACRSLAGAGAAFHARACEAENLSLRGQHAPARSQLQRLLSPNDLPPGTRTWLLTTQAEAELRAGRPSEAERAFREALAGLPDEYTRIAYADFLLDQRRPAEVAPLLRSLPRSEAVLLRLAIAAARGGASGEQPDIAELRARMAQAALRPDARTTHAREQALYLGEVQRDPQGALAAARANVALQREPIDLLLLARAARAAGDADALALARRLRDDTGLHDARLDAVLAP